MSIDSRCTVLDDDELTHCNLRTRKSYSRQQLTQSNPFLSRKYPVISHFVLSLLLHQNIRASRKGSMCDVFVHDVHGIHDIDILIEPFWRTQLGICLANTSVVALMTSHQRPLSPLLETKVITGPLYCIIFNDSHQGCIGRLSPFTLEMYL